MNITAEQIKNDIIQSLSVGRPSGDDVVTFTTRELSELTGRSVDSARGELERMVEAGIATKRRIVEDGSSKYIYIIDAESWRERYGEKEKA